MKKFSSDEADKLPPGGGGRSTYLRQMLLSLQAGEMIVMSKEEWKGKGNPYEVANRISRRLGWVFKKSESADKTEWQFRRLK